MVFFMVHNKSVVLEFHSRIRIAINAYNIFSNEIIKNQFSGKKNLFAIKYTMLMKHC